MTKSGSYLTLLTLSALLLCSSCSNIKLSSKGGTTGSGGGSSTILTPANSAQDVPPLTGDWQVSFMYGENAYNSTVAFSQLNKDVTGQGKDEATGKDFSLTGTVDGNKVHFTKKYIDIDPSRQPVEYTGEFEYLNDADYRGWKMGGHYKTVLNGQPVDDKWVAVPLMSQEPPSLDQGPPPEQSQGQDSGYAGDQSSGSVSNEYGPNISGQWNASYTYNFKKITSKLWLEQDNHHVGGHGVDVNTNEHFNVQNGWYYYPKLTLKLNYIKGKQAAQTRDLTIQAKVNGGPALSGETNYGGAWKANLVR